MSTDSTAEEVNNNLGKSFDWANASNEFKKLMQDVHNIHRRYAAEDVSGSWAKNAVANLFTQFLSTPPVQTAGEQWNGDINLVIGVVKRLCELKPYHMNPYNLGDMGEMGNLIDTLSKIFKLLPQPPTQ